MKISTEQVGKKFNRHWIFRNFTKQFQSGKSYAILGPNGSGKSTMLQVLCGFILPTEGKVFFYDEQNKEIEDAQFYKNTAYAAPYLELLEEFTLEEQIKFHQGFKSFRKGLGIEEVMIQSGLIEAKDKQIRYFSSGVKQRLRLSLALLSDVPCIFLDEPLTNLDKNGYDWYHSLVNKIKDESLIIVCSNHQKDEYDFCSEIIEIAAFKS